MHVCSLRCTIIDSKSSKILKSKFRSYLLLDIWKRAGGKSFLEVGTSHFIVCVCVSVCVLFSFVLFCFPFKSVF